MAAQDSPYRDLVESRVFLHWLRSGLRADAEAVIDHIERKFNPYHADDGKFTSPPGVTVSYGRPGSESGVPPRSRSAPKSGARSATVGIRRQSRQASAQSQQEGNSGSENGFRSDLVSNSVSPVTSNAVSFFELRKRQAHLDRLRRQAGPNPDPAVRADLDDFQRRLDSNRQLLHASAKIADREVFELLRAGLAPVDIAAALFNIARSEAELRDYLSVAGVVPIAGVVGKVGKLGGSGTAASSSLKASRRSLQHSFKHAKVFGIEGNASNRSLAEFTSAIQRHVTDEGTRAIQGTFRGRPVTHFVNPETGLNVMRDQSGHFLSGFRLKPKQLEHVLLNGKLGGS